MDDSKITYLLDIPVQQGRACPGLDPTFGESQTDLPNSAGFLILANQLLGKGAFPAGKDCSWGFISAQPTRRAFAWPHCVDVAISRHTFHCHSACVARYTGTANIFAVYGVPCISHVQSQR